MEKNETKEVRIKRVLTWTIPTFGNRHIMPYGKLLVTDGETTKVCSTKGDLYTDVCTHPACSAYSRQYITFKRKRYYVNRVGSPCDGMKITLEPAD